MKISSINSWDQSLHYADKRLTPASRRSGPQGTICVMLHWHHLHPPAHSFNASVCLPIPLLMDFLICFLINLLFSPDNFLYRHQITFLGFYWANKIQEENINNSLEIKLVLQQNFKIGNDFGESFLFFWSSCCWKVWFE